MKKNAITALEWIYTSELYYNLWNMETTDNSTWIYEPKDESIKELPPHIALFEMSNAPDEILDLCDEMTWSTAFGKVYFYWL